MRSVFALIGLILLPVSAKADVVCPDLQRDKASFQLVARGTVKEIIEPVYEWDCAHRNQFGQCEAPLERKETPLLRMMFEADEIFYVSPGISPYFLNTLIAAGSRIEDHPNLSHRMVIVGRKDMLQQKGLLASFSKFRETQDLDAASGCDSFLPESAADYAQELEKAKRLRQ